MKSVFRRFSHAPVFLGLVFATLSAHAQVGNMNFTVSFGTTAAQFVQISGQSGSTSPALASGSTDDGVYPLVPIGFSFSYQGQVFTQVSANTNGILTFGALSSSSTTTNLSSGTPRPFLSPFNSDTETPTFSYRTEGTSPNRIFTAEWLNVEWQFNSNQPNLTFQVKLYEGSNRIEFHYRREAGTPSGSNAVIGIAGALSGSGNFISLTTSGPLNGRAAPQTSATTVSSVDTIPATGQVYTFTPIAGGQVPTATTNAASGVTQTAAVLNASINPNNSQTQYFFEYGTTTSYGTQTTQQTLAAGTQAIPVTASILNLSAGTTYNFRIVAINANGRTNGANLTFTTASSPLTAPTLLAPANGATVSLPRVNFSISAVTGATSYRIEIDPSGQDFASSDVLSATSSNPNGMFADTSVLRPNTIYAWRARASDANGSGPFSTVFTFTTASTTVVPAPTLVSPADRATGLPPAAIDFSWSAVTGATGYRLQLSTSPSFTPLFEFAPASNAFRLTDFTPNTQYFWRVRTRTATDSSALSGTFSFTTAGAQTTPTLLLPANGATNQRVDTVQVSWTAVTGATAYRLQVATENTFASPTINQVFTGTVVNVFNNTPNTQYFWRVRVETPTVGSYSTPFSFTTGSSGGGPGGTVSINANPRTIEFPANPVARDYKLVGIPGNLSDGINIGGSNVNPIRLRNIISSGTQGRDWRVFRDNGAASDFLEELSGESTIFNGEGLWMIGRGNITIPAITGSVTLRPDRTFLLPMNFNAWNIIVSPFNASVSVADIRRANNLPDNQQFFRWSNGGFTPAVALEPFEGLYYREGRGQGLFIPAPTTGAALPDQTVQSTAASPTASEAALYSWRVQLSFETDVNSDRYNFIGVAPTAKQGFDNLDGYKPPMVFDAGFLYFPHREWNDKYSRFNEDYRPTIGDGQVWEFETRHPRQSISAIHFGNLASVPSEYEIYLVNLANSSTAIDLRRNSEYRFQHIGEVVRFKLLIGKREFVAAQIGAVQPRTFELSQNYPNPFNPSTVISYQLPISSEVSLKVYDMLGRELQTLVNTRQDAGRYTVLFNATSLASGLYFYRLQAGTFVETRKMTLVK